MFTNFRFGFLLFLLAVHFALLGGFLYVVFSEQPVWTWVGLAILTVINMKLMFWWGDRITDKVRKDLARRMQELLKEKAQKARNNPPA